MSVGEVLYFHSESVVCLIASFGIEFLRESSPGFDFDFSTSGTHTTAENCAPASVLCGLDP